jgi:trans-aconitate methyltransferase
MPYNFGPVQAADFPARLAALAAKHAPVAGNGRVTRALDVGCAVGGATFALARHFSAAHGIDYSAAFVAAAKRLQARRAVCLWQLDLSF